MSENILYYSFSTVPQVLAAIIALTGFFWLFYQKYYTKHMWRIYEKEVGRPYSEAFKLINKNRDSLSEGLQKEFDELSKKYFDALRTKDLPRLFHAIEKLRNVLTDVRPEFMNKLPIPEAKKSKKIRSIIKFTNRSMDNPEQTDPLKPE